jgi:hypothetical protein
MRLTFPTPVAKQSLLPSGQAETESFQRRLCLGNSGLTLRLPVLCRCFATELSGQISVVTQC